MIIRKYDPQKDKDAVVRIWREVGWADKDKEEQVAVLLEACRTFVAEMDGMAECAVTGAPGVIRYQEEDLPFSCCTSAVTSLVARKQGLLRRTLAHLLATEASQGALVAGLGIFDQGFYNHLGYGTGSYEHWFCFDPASLRIAVKPRAPRRFTRENISLVHVSRMARRRLHGGVNFENELLTTQDVIWSKDGFGLGYCDGPKGELTHHLWISPKGERGPHRINWLVYQTREQFLELMALLKSFADQWHLVALREVPGLQLQDLLDRPFRHRSITEKSPMENRADAQAYWQMRILDLPACLMRTHLPYGEVKFNLHLSDPIVRYLEESESWRGCAGEYVIALGSTSGATRGSDTKLPTLKASINAFTRLWLGVQPASGLAITDELSGPPELIEQLDQVVRLPIPKPDWDF